MRPSRGMGAIAPSKMPKARKVVRKDGPEPTKLYKKGGKVRKFSDGGIAPYGVRHSGEGAKGKGYFGKLPTKDGFATELSVESDRAGEHPLLVPTLTKKEINHLLSGGEPTNSIYEKAERYALERKDAGKSPFAGSTELRRPLPPTDEDSYRLYKKGGRVPKSKVNEAGNYTKPGMRKSLFERVKAGGKGGKPGQWSARKAQMLAREYKAKGGGYKD